MTEQTSTRSQVNKPNKGFIREWGPLILILTVIVLSRVFIWSNVSVDGPSMDPSLANNQKLVMLMTGGFSRGDIVVAKETVAQTRLNDGSATTGKTIVKRVIGLPGDTLVFDHDKLTINGKVYSQPWLTQYKTLFDNKQLAALYEKSLALAGVTGTELTTERAEFAAQANRFSAFTVDTVDNNSNPTFTVKVPAGQYYLMGDNRIVSADSRRVGTFVKSQIQGRVVFRLWPLSKFGTVN